MRYRLIKNSANDLDNVQQTILNNRGILKANEYLNLKRKVLHDYNLLNNIDEGIKCIIKYLENKCHIHIIVDCDVDGVTSATTMYLFLKLVDPECNITYSMHEGKRHGLSNDINIPECDLLIIPDASSNDFKQHKEWKEKGTEILILDHHECEKESENAIVINNQLSNNYPNKNLSGVGVVYKFCKALDDELWTDYADEFIDLVALGNIGDVMNLTEYETKYLIDKGLRHVNNPFFKALINKQSYPMKNKVTIMGVAFYIVPLINACMRFGTMQEKEMMFRAFIGSDETFEYKKRGQENIIIENIYDHMARICGYIKTKQDKEKNKSSEIIYERIENKQLYNNKVIFLNISKTLDKALTGLVASQVADKYKRPCLLLRKDTIKNGQYTGSGRNFNNSEIEDFKASLAETGLFTFVEGHPNAFGVGILTKNIPKAIESMNIKFADVIFDDIYQVDFIVDAEDLDMSIVYEIDKLQNVWGHGVDESLVAIENIEVDTENIEFIGKVNKNTLKFTYNDVTFIKFGLDEDEIANINKQDNKITFTVIGTCELNEYGNRKIPQIMIKDMEWEGENK